MMRSSIATYKESLSRIASDVQDAADEFEIPAPRGGDEASFADRRISHRFAQSTSPAGSPVCNGAVSPVTSMAEIELHKAEIQRLKTSESEIKAVAVNYAAMLKEKEEELSRIHEENSSLKKSFEAKTAVAHASKSEDLEGFAEQSPNRQHKHTSQTISRSYVNNGLRGKQELLSNGNVLSGQIGGAQQKIDAKVTNLRSEKELGYPINGNGRAVLPTQSKYASEVKELKVQLDNERENLANLEIKYQEQQKKNESLQKELHDLKMEKERMSLDIREIHNDMDTKVSEIKRLELEVNEGKLAEASNESLLDRLRNEVLTLQNENVKLQREKAEVEATLKHRMDDRQENTETTNSGPSKMLPNLDEVIEDMSKKIQQLENSLTVSCKERDKALQELNRLKKHLLDKELEESDKMDEDNKLIEELQAHVASQRAHILKLERALKQENLKNEEVNKMKSDEVHQANEIVNGLKQKVTNYMSILESKNAELLNLQTALGQYYAEAEAKERLERDMVVAREEAAKLSESLKAANELLERSKNEKEEVISKLAQAERMLSEGKLTVQKLQEDNLKLRRTLEQSMTRINRMSLDSDYSVDRRIVIKLLVTYFERNHSKEVLDLMVRMLGFSEEDKQRIGLAQQAARKGIVRGVLGFSGRLVGGILGGASPEGSHSRSENQSFADLWVDFLLKETEEREKRELAEASKKSSSDTVHKNSGAAQVPPPPAPEYRTTTATPSSSTTFPTVHLYPHRFSTPAPSRQPQPFEQSDAEFATVPLTSSPSPPLGGPTFSRPPPPPPPRY